MKKLASLLLDEEGGSIARGFETVEEKRKRGLSGLHDNKGTCRQGLSCAGCLL